MRTELTRRWLHRKAQNRESRGIGRPPPVDVVPRLPGTIEGTAESKIVWFDSSGRIGHMWA
jgi:hypothetical protein